MLLINTFTSSTGAFMRSFKNHFSLVVALLGILFSVQVYLIIDRAIGAYQESLAKSYSLVVVSQKALDIEEILKRDKNFAQMSELSPEGVIKRLNADFSQKNIELLKLTLPKFYKLKLHAYPTPKQIEQITQKLKKNSSVTKVEAFAKTHDTTYKFLLLVQSLVSIFVVSVLIVTILLIFKELRIWQFKHHERMSIMALFGAPVWLRSAVLFRLAIVDAFVATGASALFFAYIASTPWIGQQLASINIEVVVFYPIEDSLIMLGISMAVSILLATFIVIGHKEEV